MRHKKINSHFHKSFLFRKYGGQRQWEDIFKVLKGKPNKQKMSRILYAAKLPFNKGKIKTFPDKQKLKEFVADLPYKKC